MLTKTPSPNKKTTDRKCIATGDVVARDRLIRFVLDPAGCVVADLAGNLPGRGAWVTARRELVVKAVARRAFNRAFAAEVSVNDLACSVEDGLRRRALSALGLARRAGMVLVGFDQVAAILKERKAVILLTASDASEDGAAKLARFARDIVVMRDLSSVAISEALGRDGVRHAALKDCKETEGLKRDILRFHDYVRPEGVQEDLERSVLADAGADI